MNILASYFDIEEIEVIKDTYEANIFKSLDEDNINAIINYLKINNVYFYKDILFYCLDLFLIDEVEFIKKFEQLKNKYSCFVDNLSVNLELLEEMYSWKEMI